MKQVLLGFLLVLAVGCQAGRTYVEDIATEVDRGGFGGAMQASLVFDSTTQGHMKGHEIHVHPAWVWENSWSVAGLVAHVFIHAKLGTTDHGAMFQAERQRVAAALKIPVAVIPDGKGETQIEVTRDMLLTVASLQAWRARSINPVKSYLPAKWLAYEDVPPVRP
jgi:hypothetical protein